MRRLHDEDFPSNYKNMAHPDDYTEVENFSPQFIYHSHFGKHNRLIARVAWKISDTVMIPMSFICDTGAPKHLYLSQEALETLAKYRLISEGETETLYVKIHKNITQTFNAPFEETPHMHKHANILGLKALRRLHLNLNDDNFCFNSEFVYF